MLGDLSCSDVTFSFHDGGPTVMAHKVLLCSASDVFRRIILKTDERCSYEDLFDSITTVPDHNAKEMSGQVATQMTVVKLSSDISRVAFQSVLEFLYTGSLSWMTTGNVENTEHIKEVSQTAKKFHLDLLVESCENVVKNNPAPNADISSAVNTATGQTAKEHFLNKSQLCDVTFLVEDTVVFAHKAVLLARSAVMQALLNGSFKENGSYQVRMCLLVELQYRPLV